MKSDDDRDNQRRRSVSAAEASALSTDDKVPPNVRVCCNSPPRPLPRPGEIIVAVSVGVDVFFCCFIAVVN
jgi:hypothetical protein